MISKDTPQPNILSLAPSCTCEGCSHGCSMGSGFLADNDLKPMAAYLKVSLEELKKKHLEEVELFHIKKFRPKLERLKGKPYGPCSFFKGGRCSVHSVKPLQCKISMGCKEYGWDLNLWFMLNHLVGVDDPESVRQYASYLKSGGKTIAGGKLEELVPDAERLKKILSYEIL
ncbi:MAG: YkgJ family cysteine cluster protein [Nanoarchaeota archaeon]|nr:YkgJ family cysteine cluster protein [Nanoarchaeota archaeon]